MADQKKDRTFLIVATVIDLVIIYDMSSGNPIVQNWYKQNLPFLLKLQLGLTLKTASIGLLVSTGFFVLHYIIAQGKYFKDNKGRTRKRIIYWTVFAGLTLSGLMGHYLFLNPEIIDLGMTLLFALSYFFVLGEIAGLFRANRILDIADDSDKMGKIKAANQIMVNEYSFNWKTNKGYVNLCNPFRGILLVGTNGSGKTYTIIEEIIDQAFRKDYTAFLYDFKFPNIATYAWNSYQINYIERLKDKKSALPIPDFYVIYFKDIRYSHRCNPLHPSILKEKAYALQAAKTILYNINPEWIKKQGEFFSSSAIAVMQAITWYLKIYATKTGKNVSTLPHVIEFASYPNNSMWMELLMTETETSTIITPLTAAKNAGALEQLAGQVASLQIGLSQIVDKKIYYVMSEHNFDLAINDPAHPKIIILGNDDDLQQAYAPVLSLYASTIKSSINKKNQRHSLYCVDEFPTMYIMDIQNLPNTGRSNKICTLLGSQNFAQAEDKYGVASSKTLNASFANIILGQANDEQTAKYAQTILGNYLAEKEDFSFQFEGDGGSLSKRVESRQVIHLNDMFELNQGVLLGKVADAGESTAEKKFFAEFQITKAEHPHRLPKFNKELKDLSDEQIDDMLTEHTRSIKDDVEQIILDGFFTSKIRGRLNANTDIQLKLDEYVKFIFHNKNLKDDAPALHNFKIQVMEEITKSIVKAVIQKYLTLIQMGAKNEKGKETVEDKVVRELFLIQIKNENDVLIDNQLYPGLILKKKLEILVQNAKTDAEMSNSTVN